MLMTDHKFPHKLYIDFTSGYFQIDPQWQYDLQIHPSMSLQQIQVPQAVNFVRAKIRLVETKRKFQHCLQISLSQQCPKGSTKQKAFDSKTQTQSRNVRMSFKERETLSFITHSTLFLPSINREMVSPAGCERL